MPYQAVGGRAAAGGAPPGFPVSKPFVGVMPDAAMSPQQRPPWFGSFVGWIQAAVLLLGVGLVAMLAVHRLRAPPPAPAWAVALVSQAGDSHGEARGKRGTPYRETVEALFDGSHVAGFAAGRPRGDMFIARHSGEHGTEEYGPVVLSENAKLLRRALQQQGFVHGTYWHGTENAFVPSILSGGFLVSDGMLGVGIYTTATFAHAQCYSPGEGQPILELEIYWDPANKHRYIKHVAHQSLANDVMLVSDPLLIFPVAVHACCPQKLTCVR
uniref:PARP catalytic domain-containing protein n=1 Tax=Zooxanthella nutricula TaxID=1333877 RepID=A0A7S2KTD7_9DINO|mmetsp:Transcript_52070/g.158098  ORF Transcript_52070/g.158098 Transcript_52070/m.158098 type:complete len:270 (+) Transcript_52070:3-812(+)